MQYTEVQLTESLKGVSFKGFPKGLRWDEIFKRDAITFECNKFDPSIFKARLINYIKLFYSGSYGFESKLNPTSKILFFNSDLLRKSCYEQTKNVADTVKEKDIIQVIGHQNKLHFFKGVTILTCYYNEWRRTLSSAGVPKRYELAVLSQLISLFLFKDFVTDKVEFDKYKMIVSFYDSLLFDSYIIELCRLRGIKTASLQHGQFTRWKENTLINSGVELRTFKSDYLLCWNKFTIDEAVATGIDKNKLVLTGIIGYAKREHAALWTNPNNKIFGVVLGHPAFEEQNLLLIQCANKLAEARGFKYYLKLHPNYEEDYFDDVINKELFIGVIPKGIPMEDYAKMVEFSMLGGSSVLNELVYLRHPTIRVSDGTVNDKFGAIPHGMVFHESSDVVTVFDTGNFETESMFDYLCSIENVKEGYLNFFKSISDL